MEVQLSPPGVGAAQPRVLKVTHKPPTKIGIEEVPMALTIGVRTYASNADLRHLCGDPQFTEALRAELSHISNDGQRQQAMTGAMAKLKKWVTHEAKYGIQYGRRGQDKSFPSREAAVKWLVYKQRKTFADNQRTETRLAEEVNGNAPIKRLLFAFLRQYLVPWWASQSQDLRRKVGGGKGRYAFFYSKAFATRTIAEGFQYFSAAGGGVLSIKVTETNLSISELAAFVADVALAVKGPLGIHGKHVGGVDSLRVNQVMLDQKTRQALDGLFDRVLTVFDVGRNADALTALDNAVRTTAKDLERPSVVQVLIAQVYSILNALEQNATAIPGDFAGAFPSGPEQLDRKTPSRRLRRELERGLEPKDIPALLQRHEAAIRVCLTTPRIGAAEALSLINGLADEMAADVNRVPVSLRERNAQLFRMANKEGKDRNKRMDYNVDVDHQWTQFMISQSAVVGAGPSGTTSFALALTEQAAGGALAQTRALFEYAVAMALFSFWQRKKKALRMSAAVHTWNEVCAALDHHRGPNALRRSRDGFLQVRATGADGDGEADSGFHIYEYPAGFDDRDGRPEYGRGAGWEMLLAD